MNVTRENRWFQEMETRLIGRFFIALKEQVQDHIISLLKIQNDR
jgi:hypothetical protein